LEPEFWRQFELAAALDGASVRCRPVKGMATTGSWHFFVSRSDLDALYPSDKPTQVDPTPPGLRRGPKAKYDWPAIEREIVRRCIDPKTKALRIPENQSQLANGVLEWCQLKYNTTPTDGAMRAAVRRVSAMLRQD
jgi:hypothetical protein